MKVIFALLILFCGTQVFAWGKQGHAIINQTAALLLADFEDKDFLKEHAFDLSYFANVPDIVWKGEKTFQIEEPQHFMDLEVFERELKIKKLSTKDKLPEAFFLDREEFDTKYPNIAIRAGRAWWRIRELADLLNKQSAFLADSRLSVKDRHDLEAQWLVIAGVLGHYVGDLSQPLHLTENYDGQLTGQKGIHSYFEDKLVNELIPQLSKEVLTSAKKKWPAFTKANHESSTLTLIANLSEFSRKNIKQVLSIERGKKHKKSAPTKLIVGQLVEGSLVVAELWRRNLDWKFNGQRFYTFISTPDYILPGTSRSAHVQEIKTDSK